MRKGAFVAMVGFAALGWLGVIAVAALSAGTPPEQVAEAEMARVLAAPALPGVEPPPSPPVEATGEAEPAVGMSGGILEDAGAGSEPEDGKTAPAPDTAAGVLAAARQCLDAGDYEGALSLFEKAAQKRPALLDDPEFVYWSAVALEGVGDLPKAVTYYARVCDIAPQHALAQEAAFDLPRVLLRAAKLEEAVAAAKRAVAFHPVDRRAPQVLVQVAEALESAARLTEAAELYERVSAEYPDYKEPGEFFYRAGRARWEAGDAEGAVKVLSAAVEVEGPFLQKARYYLGASLYRLERYSEAIKVFEAASIEGWTPREVATALYWSGMCYLKLERYAEAAAAFSQLVETYRVGTQDEVILSAVARGGYMLGDALYGAGNLEAAVVAYQRALEYAPESRMAPWGAYRIGVCLRRLGRPLEAQQAFRRVSERYPGTFWAEQAQWDASDIAWQMENGLVVASEATGGGK